MTAHIDDCIVRYTAAVHPCFEDLKQALAQMAGLLVLSARDPLLFRSAREAHRRAVDGLKSTPVPNAANAHHDLLLRACDAIAEALESQADTLPLLNSAHAYLRAASRELPGFEMVDFNAACCSARAQVNP